MVQVIPTWSAQDLLTIGPKTGYSFVTPCCSVVGGRSASDTWLPKEDEVRWRFKRSDICWWMVWLTKFQRPFRSYILMKPREAPSIHIQKHFGTPFTEGWTRSSCILFSYPSANHLFAASHRSQSELARANQWKSAITRVAAELNRKKVSGVSQYERLMRGSLILWFHGHGLIYHRS